MKPMDEIGEDDDDTHEYASPACFMHEVNPAYSMGLQQAGSAMDVAGFERRLIANASDGVLYADQDGIIRFWNAGCHRIFGFTEQEAVGQSLDIIIPELIESPPLARLCGDHAQRPNALRRGRSSCRAGFAQGRNPDIGRILHCAVS